MTPPFLSLIESNRWGETFLFQPVADKHNEFPKQIIDFIMNFFLDLALSSEEIVKVSQNLKEHKQITFCVAKKTKTSVLISCSIILHSSCIFLQIASNIRSTSGFLTKVINIIAALYKPSFFVSPYPHSSCVAEKRYKL